MADLELPYRVIEICAGDMGQSHHRSLDIEVYAPGADDWLGRGNSGEKDRCGQPMKRFLQPGPHRNFPTRQRSKIYIMPLGDVGAAPPTSFFTELLKRCFLSLRLRPSRGQGQYITIITLYVFSRCLFHRCYFSPLF